MIRRYCENACFDGILDLYESRNHKPKFVFWAIVVTLMFFASVWFTYRTIIGYMDTPTVTSVTTVRSAAMEMPEVLICYNGGLNVLTMTEANLTENLIQNFHTNFYGYLPGPSDNNFVAASVEFEAYLSKNKFGIKEFVQKFSYSCEDIVEQFIFLMNISNGCQMVAESITTPRGNCFSFINIGVQTFPALSGGMLFKLKLPKNSFSQTYPIEARDLDLGNDYSLTLEKTLGGEQSSRSIIIAPNMRTEVTLWTKLYTRSVCDSDPTLYGSNTCNRRCYVRTLIKVCNCMPDDYWTTFFGNNISACNPLNNTCELNDTNYAYMSACQANCMPMCAEWIFETSLSSSSFDNSNNSSLAFVKVGYNTLQYTKIEEVAAFTLDMAIANVGGQSGLWLGCSIITIIQAIYYIFLGCCQCMFAKKSSLSDTAGKRSNSIKEAWIDYSNDRNVSST